MATIEDRWYRTIENPETGKKKTVKTHRHGKGDRYRVRYRDEFGRQRSQSFPDKKKRLAVELANSLEAKKATGDFVDPARGKVALSAYSWTWLEGRELDAKSREAVQVRLNNQIVPYFQDMHLYRISTEVVREWLAWLKQRKLSQNYRAACFETLSAIMSAAKADRRIPINPCEERTLNPPKRHNKKVAVWHKTKLSALYSAMPEHYRISLDLGAGCGLRQGEILGFSPDDISDSEEAINIVRQVRIVQRKLVFAPPKFGKERQVPLSEVLRARIFEHETKFGTVAVTLPWLEPDGVPITVKLLLRRPSGDPWSGDSFNKSVWHKMFKAAGIPYQTGVDGMHALRHFYASTVLARGVSIKELAEYLGHSDPGFTLRTYTHLVPSSHERARRAVDALFRTTAMLAA